MEALSSEELEKIAGGYIYYGYIKSISNKEAWYVIHEIRELVIGPFERIFKAIECAKENKCSFYRTGIHGFKILIEEFEWKRGVGPNNYLVRSAACLKKCSSNPHPLSLYCNYE